MSPRAWMLRLRDVMGGLAVIGTLALLSPGVSVTASAETGSDHAAGPMCQGNTASAEQLSLELEWWMDMLRERAAAQPAPTGDDDVVVLNNRGYYYGPPSVPEREPIEREAPRP